MSVPEDVKAQARRRVLRTMAERHATQAALAEKAKVDPNTISDFLAGKRWPRAATLGRIEQALELTPGTLVDAGEDAQPDSPLGDQPERIFERWARATNEALMAQIDYASTRRLTFEQARRELFETLVMSEQMKDGRPWTPPWDDYPEGEEPWRESWWHEKYPPKYKTLDEAMRADANLPGQKNDDGAVSPERLVTSDQGDLALSARRARSRGKVMHADAAELGEETQDPGGLGGA